MGDSSIITGVGSAFLRPIFASLGSAALREIGLIWGVDDNFRKLVRTFMKIQDLMAHMEGNPLKFSGGGAHGGSRAWQMWFEDMRKLTYDADELLDQVFLRHSRHLAENNVNQVFPMVVSSFSSLILPHEIGEMQNKLEELTKELESLVVIEKVKRDSCKLASTRLTQFTNLYSPATFVNDANVVGREKEKEDITKLLFNVPERGNFSVISLVGMPGIGKTTLARYVYDDPLVRASFDMRIWVSISMDFNVARIMRSIIEFQTLSACNLSDLYALQETVGRILNGKKFLLVLDDYWSNLHDEWDVLSSPFRFGSSGSKIIVTTRSAKTSSIIGSSKAYTLRILSEGYCWDIIKQRVFGDEDPNQILEPIGREIGDKCKGLPLVAVTLGSLLRCKNSEDEWRSILGSELWDMPQDTNVFPALMLSYLNLPVHLQKCFAYCSIFPQNHKFEVEELVLLWMAEGFIHPLGSRRLEDLGHDYFDDLYSRCFFQLCENENERYKMHDVIRDIARLVSQDICFHVKYSMLISSPLFGNAYHLSLLDDSTESMKLEASLENTSLRTFLVIRGSKAAATGNVDGTLFQNLQFLRVLGLSYIGLKEVPDSIDKLEYLRYLNLSGNPFKSLPKSMCKLVLLQTLKLRECDELLNLPNDIWKLSKLRHLYVEVSAIRKWKPLNFGRLVKLQNLPLYVVGTEKGSGIEELKDMVRLRGALRIENIHNVSNANDAAAALLKEKKYLDKLELHWGGEPIRSTQIYHVEEVLQNLEPHQNLKELVMDTYRGRRYPGWLSEACRKFTSIHLHMLEDSDHLPALGQLPCLKSLTISNMDCLETIDHTFYGTGDNEKFPVLEVFSLNYMKTLVTWQDDVRRGAMPRLRYLTIHDCPKLNSIPQRFQNLPGLNVMLCPNLLIGAPGQP